MNAFLLNEPYRSHLRLTLCSYLLFGVFLHTGWTAESDLGAAFDEILIPVRLVAKWNPSNETVDIELRNITDSSVRIHKTSLENPKILYSLTPQKMLSGKGLAVYSGSVFSGLSSIDVVSAITKAVSGKSWDTIDLIEIPAGSVEKYSFPLSVVYKRISSLVKGADAPMKLRVKLEFFNLYLDGLKQSESTSGSGKNLQIMHTSWLDVPVDALRPDSSSNTTTN